MYYHMIFDRDLVFSNGNTLSSGSEYLGTNSYHPLVFKVNNVQFARFHPNGGMAFGNGAVASDSDSVAIGTAATTTTNNQAVAIGPSATASYQSVSIGLNASTSANTTIAIGSSAKVNQQNGISIGTTTESNQDATAVGFNSKATGYQSSAFGNGTSATGQNSTAIGNGATVAASNTIQLGNTSVTAVNTSGAVTALQYKLSALNTAPTSATDTGVLGEIRVTATAIYICTATNTWVKAALATF